MCIYIAIYRQIHGHVVIAIRCACIDLCRKARNPGDSHVCGETRINTLQVDGKPYSDSSSKAGILNNYFSSVFTKDDQSPLPNIDSEPVPNILQITVEEEEVYNLLTNLDLTKLQAQILFPQNFLKKLHYTWLHYSLLFFKPYLTRENYHLIENLLISY